MNRTETLTQLNQERKRKENRVWEEWFKTENSNQVTSERLVKRTTELNRIRDEYEKAVFQINNQGEQEVSPLFTPITSPQKQQNKQTAQVSQKEEGVVRGAENLPENKPISLGQEIRKRTTEPAPTQEDVREPEIVRTARAQNQSDVTYETSNENNFEIKQNKGMSIVGQKKSVPKLSIIESLILIIVGLIADLINLVPFVNILVTLIITPMLVIYFRLKKLPVHTSIATGLLELIPVLSILPGVTLGIIITILIDRLGPMLEEKASVSEVV